MRKLTSTWEISYQDKHIYACTEYKDNLLRDYFIPQPTTYVVIFPQQIDELTEAQRG